MNVWPGIISLVSSKTAITDVIGTSPMRLFPVRLPQGLTTFPSVAYRTVVITGNPNFDGSSGLDFVMADFLVYANTQSDVQSVMDLLRNQLEDTEGTFSGLTIKNVRYVDSGQMGWEDTTEKCTGQIEFKISVTRG